MRRRIGRHSLPRLPHSSLSNEGHPIILEIARIPADRFIGPLPIQHHTNSSVKQQGASVGIQRQLSWCALARPETTRACANRSITQRDWFRAASIEHRFASTYRQCISTHQTPLPYNKKLEETPFSSPARSPRWRAAAQMMAVESSPRTNKLRPERRYACEYGPSLQTDPQTSRQGRQIQPKEAIE